MPRYLLSAHTVDGEARQPMTDEQMQHSWQEIQALEAEMKSAGAWVFLAACMTPTPPRSCVCPTARW